MVTESEMQRDLEGEREEKKVVDRFFFIWSKTEDVSGPDRIGTETVKCPFSWTDGLGPVRLTEPRSVFVEPYFCPFEVPPVSSLLGSICLTGLTIACLGQPIIPFKHFHFGGSCCHSSCLLPENEKAKVM